MRQDVYRVKWRGSYGDGTKASSGEGLWLMPHRESVPRALHDVMAHVVRHHTTVPGDGSVTTRVVEIWCGEGQLAYMPGSLTARQYKVADPFVTTNGDIVADGTEYRGHLLVTRDGWTVAGG